MGRDAEYETSTAAYDFSPSGDQMLASDYDNVHPRHQSYPLIKHITPYINPSLQRILVPVYYTLGGRAALTLKHVLFTTFLVAILATPPAIAYTAWQYTTTGTLPTLTLPATTPVIGPFSSLSPITDQITLPVLIAVYVFTAYSISTILHAPWDEFAPGHFNYHKNRVDHSDIVTQQSPSRITISGSILIALVATWLLYVSFTTVNPGLLATIGIFAVSASGYLAALFFGLLFVPHPITSGIRLVAIPTLPFVLPVSHTEFGVLLLTAGIVLKICYDIPIGQLTSDWFDDTIDYYPRPKWILGTWGILIAGTLSAVLGGPIYVTATGYVAAQLGTIAFFAYRTRVPTGQQWARESVADYHGTTGPSTQETVAARITDQLHDRLSSDAVTEFFTNPLPSGDDELVEDIHHAVQELNETAGPYTDTPLVDASNLESLSKPGVKRLHRDAGTLAENETKPPQVRRAARRLEHITGQALDDWTTNE